MMLAKSLKKITALISKYIAKIAANQGARENFSKNKLKAAIISNTPNMNANMYVRKNQ